MVQSGHFLRISRYAGLSGTIARLERYMGTESIEEQLSGTDIYYLNFGGWGVSLR
jgi:hypothetical protein